MKEKGERAEELEILMRKLERDNESLQKKVASLGITCEKVCFPPVSVPTSPVWLLRPRFQPSPVCT